MTKSQKAFEETIKDQGYDLSKNADGNFSDVTTHLDFIFWCTAWQASRKQTLEELQAIYPRTYPSTEAQWAAIKEILR